MQGKCFWGKCNKFFQGCFFFCFCFSGLGMESLLGLRLESSIPNMGITFFQKNKITFFKVIFFVFGGLGLESLNCWVEKIQIWVLLMLQWQFFLNFCKYFKWTFYDTITIVSVSEHGLWTLLGLTEVKRLALDSSANT